MRAALLGVTLTLVLAASACNLVLGAVWVMALGTVALLRWGRRVRFAPELTLLLVLGVAAAGIHLRWFAPPPARSYAADELGWLLERLPVHRGPPTTSPRSGPSDVDPAGSLRARLEARRLEELHGTAAEFQRRAAADVGLTRDLGRLRTRAPREAAALEVAVRRLALTLTAPEFRDLAGRRARLEQWFADLEARLRSARDESEVAAVVRALDPAAMAPVSLRAVREDLAQVDLAVLGLLRAVTAAEVSVTGTSAIRYDEMRGQLVVEDRFTIAVARPAEIRRVDVSGLRRTATAKDTVQTLAYASDGRPVDTVGGSGEVALGGGVARVEIHDRRAHAVSPRPVRGRLRPVEFGEITVDGSRPPVPELLVSLALDAEGPEVLLPVTVALPRLTRIAAPRYALHFVSRPGAVVRENGEDVWVPPAEEAAGDPPAELTIEMAPATILFRNAAFARLRPYLYEPSLAGALTLTGLAALSLALTRRRRGAAPSAPRSA